MDRDRHPDDPHASDALLRREEMSLRELTTACREVIVGRKPVRNVFPEVLELRIVNSQPVWQYVRIEVASEPGRWQSVFEGAKCVYMTPLDRMCVQLKDRDIRYVRITLSRFGDLGLMYAQIWHRDDRRIPHHIQDCSEGVRHPEHLLHDDYCAIKIGAVETAQYFQVGAEQPEMSITIKLKEDSQYRPSLR